MQQVQLSGNQDVEWPAPPSERENEVAWGAAELAATLDATGIAVWALDLSGLCVFINRAACQMLGYSREECIGHGLNCRIHGHLQGAWNCPLQECRIQSCIQKCAAARVEDVFWRSDGTPVQVEYTVQPIVIQGRIRGAVVSICEMSPQKQVEEDLRKNEYLVTRALSSAGIGMCYRELERTIASDEQFRLYGLEPRKQWLTREEWLQSVHPEDRERLLQEQSDAAEENRPYQSQFRVVWPDGSVHWLVDRGSTILDRAGVVIRRIEVTVDITDRIRAETALERFFSVSPSPLAIWGLDGYLRRANPAFERILGFTSAEMLSHPLMHFVHPEERAVASAEFDRLLISGESVGFDCRVVCKDGAYRWFTFSACAVKDDRLIYATAHDITDRKQVEDALRKSEEWLRFAQSAAGVGVWDWDAESGETRASDQQFLLYGIKPNTAFPVGDEFFGMIHPDDRQQLACHLDLVMGGKTPYQSRFRVVWPDGSIHWLLGQGQVFLDNSGKPLRLVGANVDISERMRAEVSLEEFFAICRSPLSISGFDGYLKQVNAAVIRTSGFSMEELRQRPCLEFFHPDDRAAMQAEFERLVANGGSAEFECRGLCKDGSHRWFLMSAAARKDTMLIYTFAQDITERKQMQEAIQKHADNLAQSNEELERFAYVASHDLQEPLRMVASFTQLLARRYSGRLDETADRYIHFAADGAKRMQQLIQDLLAYSRANTNDLNLGPTECEVVVRSAVHNLQAAIAESGAVVEWCPLPTLLADSGQLCQLFQNLIGNAIKFRWERTPRVQISVVDGGAEWLFSVSDNGIGLEPRQANRIFQIFQRLHGRTEYPGSGIGLAICKKVVERHGGRIWVESEPGLGSDFRFTIPKRKPDGGGDDRTG